MNKLDLAHDWYMQHAGGAKSHLGIEIGLAWEYADAMHEQQEQREIEEKKKANESQKKFMAALNGVVDQLKNKEGR